MAGLTLQTEAFVLLKREAAESFQPLTVFAREHGLLSILQRVAKKSAATAVTLDLFDEAALMLESSNQGRTWFVKETRLLNRPTGIGRSYQALQHACNFAALVARNPPEEVSRESVAALLRQAIQSFAASSRPDFVYFKSLYCLARDEGHPLRQQWMPTLPAEMRAAVDAILRTPLIELEQLTAEQLPLPVTDLLRNRLEEFLKGHTELLMD